MAIDIRNEIEAANKQLVAAFKRGDASAVASHYTPEGQLLPSSSDFVRGTEAIRAFWQGALDQGITGLTLETLEVEALGDSAVEIGRYQLFAAAGALADTGKYIVVWKNGKGGWKLHRDIWNTSQPAAS